MTDSPPERKPWHRQECDTDASYAAFRTYLELGPERSLREAYRSRYGHESATDPAGYFKDWSSAHNWVERARAWDDHVWTETLAQRERRIEELRNAIFDDAPEVLLALREIAKGTIEPASREQPKTGFGLLSIIGLDKPDTVQRHEHSGPDGSPIEHSHSGQVLHELRTAKSEVLRKMAAELEEDDDA